MDRLAPTLRPAGRPQGFQRWRQLLFLHWEISPAALRPLIPSGLDIDTFEGRAYIGLVPFTMQGVRPAWAPAVPGISNFHELNLRTYVHARGRPGVWFFSLEAANPLAVIAARAGWGLPYFHARMSIKTTAERVEYRSSRLWPGPKPANFSCDYSLSEELSSAAPGTFEHFLVERYLLFACQSGQLKEGQVHHQPYPLRRASVSHLKESIVQAATLPTPQGAPHILYSPGVDVEVFRLRMI